MYEIKIYFMFQTKKKVKRNGKHFNIPSDDLLVGDILQVDIGDILSVDGILTLGSGKVGWKT